MPRKFNLFDPGDIFDMTRWFGNRQFPWPFTTGPEIPKRKQPRKPRVILKLLNEEKIKASKGEGA